MQSSSSSSGSSTNPRPRPRLRSSPSPDPAAMIELYLTPLIPARPPPYRTILKNAPNPVHARWALIITPPNHHNCTIYKITEIKTPHCHRFKAYCDTWVTLSTYCLTAQLDPALLFKIYDIHAIFGVHMMKLVDEVLAKVNREGDGGVPWTRMFLRELEDLGFADTGTVERYEGGSDEVDLSELLGNVNLGDKGEEVIEEEDEDEDDEMEC